MGSEATFQLRAALEQRNLEKVIGWNFHPEMSPNIEKAAAEPGLPFEAVGLARMSKAEVIIPIASAFALSLMADHVAPGTHISWMGTDTKGEQEVETALVIRATMFTDQIAQSISIGEAQHAISYGSLKAEDIVEIGAVINGTHPGRGSAEEITLLDGTDVGLQGSRRGVRRAETGRQKRRRDRGRFLGQRTI